MPWTKVFISKDEIENTLSRKGLRTLSYKEALREAQAQTLRSNKNAFILGEGVDDPGGIFGSTLGLVKEFGKDRIMDIPIAENGMTGVAIGAAISGMNPIFVHMRMDFLPMCMDQIINHAAKWYYMSGGTVNVPLVVRSIIGRGWGSAAQHSQALQAMLTHIPGLKVVVPGTPYDAKGLLISSIEDDNPVVFIDDRWLYNTTGEVPEEMYSVPIGKGEVRCMGEDITIVASSYTLQGAEKAAKNLKKENFR